MEVVLRHEVVETARAGDKMAFVGNLIVVPDVAAISAPGERVEARAGEVCEIVCDWAFGFGVCHPAGCLCGRQAARPLLQLLWHRLTAEATG